MAAALRLVSSTAFPLPPAYIPQASTVQVSLKPASVSLALYAGDDVSFTMAVNNADGSPADLSDVTSAIAQIKRTHSGPVVAEFDCSISTNVITLSMANAESSLLSVPSYIWDCRLQMTDGTIMTVAAGAVSASLAVSQFPIVSP